MRLLMDSAKCSGCRACQVACSLNLFGLNNPKMSALSIIPHFPEPGEYEIRTCTQCGECANVCPSGAIKVDARGVYYVVPEDCNLCEACVSACPENVMFVRAELAETSWKCDLCGDCVAVCGMDALWVSVEETAGA